MAKIIQFTSVHEDENTVLEFCNHDHYIRFFVSISGMESMSVDIDIDEIPEIISELQKIVDNG